MEDNRPAAAVDKALESAAASPHIGMDHVDLPAVRARVLKELEPTLVNITNNEPIWQSRVLWGALLSAIGATGALIGYPLSEELQSRLLETIMLWVTIGGLVSGPILTAWGRLRARKPLPL
ncbi:hypothetical protein LA66_07105 [Aureimonas altamirensis]|uniref:Uncharacterized protein n=1 Tax=Aureimonas altamirensis TaxID=370622 RepID=A0A0B1Q7D5_9HYPH|nr:hypothetical protein [Aureimonas altamirensis]KHJ56314.1 hypothetical protein LA66_07105 [Aureimonas altamirensis]